MQNNLPTNLEMDVPVLMIYIAIILRSMIHIVNCNHEVIGMSKKS